MWANIGLIAAAIPANVFAVVYFLRSDWRRWPIGSIFLALFVALSVVLDQNLASILSSGTFRHAGLDGYPLREQVRFVEYWVIAGVLWWNLLHWFQLRHADPEQLAAETFIAARDSRRPARRRDVG